MMGTINYSPSEAEAMEEYGLEVISDERRFDAIEHAWRDLHNSVDSTPFQSFEWHRTWWRHFGESDPRKTLHIVVITKDNHVVAIAPFYIKKMYRLYLLSIRRLAFIGHETTDYLDFLVADKHRQACISLIARQMFADSRRIDVVQVIDMPDRSSNHEMLFNELSTLGFRGEHFISEKCPRLFMHSTMDETLAPLASNRRSALKRIQRKVTADFNAELHIVSDGETQPEDIDEFIRLHQKRWNDIGEVGVFSGDGNTEFHHDIARAFQKQGWLFLAFLVLDGKRVAANYGFTHRQEFFHYLSGVPTKGEFSKYSIGRALHLFSMAELIKRGIRIYDFMRGTEGYKYDFGSIDAANWTVLMYSPDRLLSKYRFKIILLVDSFKRRTQKEGFLLQHVHRHHGVRGLAVHVAGRVIANLKDGIQKVAAPEKSLAKHD